MHLTQSDAHIDIAYSAEPIPHTQLIPLKVHT